MRFQTCEVCNKRRNKEKYSDVGVYFGNNKRPVYICRDCFGEDWSTKIIFTLHWKGRLEILKSRLLRGFRS